MVSEPERDRAEARRGTAAGFPETNEMSFGGSRVGGGRSLRDFGVLISFIVTRSPSVARGKPTAPAPSRREPLYVIPLRIVGPGFCPMVRGLPRAMLAPDASVGKLCKCF